MHVCSTNNRCIHSLCIDSEHWMHWMHSQRVFAALVWDCHQWPHEELDQTWFWRKRKHSFTLVIDSSRQIHGRAVWRRSDFHVDFHFIIKFSETMSTMTWMITKVKILLVILQISIFGRWFIWCILVESCSRNSANSPGVTHSGLVNSSRTISGLTPRQNPGTAVSSHSPKTCLFRSLGGSK